MFAIGLSFFQERASLQETFGSIYEGGGGEATCPAYTRFLKDFHWMHIISSLANHEFLQLEKVLDYNVWDVFAYLQYSDAKVRAEQAQMKFSSEMNKKKR